MDGAIFTMCVVSPIAFLLWWFRNSDKRIDQQHIEENIRQSDFHMIEQWATTNEKGDNLQVAAIYQLLPYLQGKFGFRFIRPSKEIFRSLLDSWILSTEETEKILEKNIEIRNIQKPNYVRAIHTIFVQEIGNLDDFTNNDYKSLLKNFLKRQNTKSRYHLKHFNFQCIEFENKTNFSEINFQNANFQWTKCAFANFSKSNLDSANFKHSKLFVCNFSSCDLSNTNFRKTNLNNVNFEKSKFYSTIFTHSYLEKVNFRNTDIGYSFFKNVNLKNTNFRGAKFERVSFLRDIDDNLKNPGKGFYSAIFDETEIVEANFSGVDLSDSIFVGSINYEEAYFDDEQLIHLKELGVLSTNKM